MNYEVRKYKQIGLIGTIFFVSTVLLILLYFGLSKPLPLPEEEGILINFGYNKTGSGNIETSKSSVVKQKKQEEKIKPKEEDKTIVSKEKLLTQDFEDAAAVEARKKKEEKRKKSEKERLEKKLREEKRKKALEEKKKKIAIQKNSDLKAKNAFANGINNGTSTSDGTGTDKGNQGSLNGDPTSKNYNSSNGLGNKGIGFSLKGRTPNGGKLPKPTYSSNEEGIVVIQVTVNQRGMVTDARYQTKGSTVTSSKLIKAAIKAAYKAKFNADNNAEQFQIGTITYKFSLQ